MENYFLEREVISIPCLKFLGMWINTTYSVDNLFTAQDVAFCKKYGTDSSTPYTFRTFCAKLATKSLFLCM